MRKYYNEFKHVYYLGSQNYDDKQVFDCYDHWLMLGFDSEYDMKRCCYEWFRFPDDYNRNDFHNPVLFKDIANYFNLDHLGKIELWNKLMYEITIIHQTNKINELNGKNENV